MKAHAEAPLEAGRAAFNGGAFFAAHELWEEVWREREGAERTAVQGLIQLAAGLHHLQEGRRRPAVRLLAKGLEKLTVGPAPLLAGLDLERLGRDVAGLVAALDASTGEALGPLALRLELSSPAAVSR